MALSTPTTNSCSLRGHPENYTDHAVSVCEFLECPLTCKALPRYARHLYVMYAILYTSPSLTGTTFSPAEHQQKNIISLSASVSNALILSSGLTIKAPKWVSGFAGFGLFGHQVTKRTFLHSHQGSTLSDLLWHRKLQVPRTDYFKRQLSPQYAQVL